MPVQSGRTGEAITESQRVFDLEEVEAFIVVVDTGGFHAAARRLYLVQSSVSRRIDNLETALGTPLLERGKDGTRVSPAGVVVLPALRALLRAHAAVQSRAALLQAQERDRVMRTAHGLYPELRSGL